MNYEGTLTINRDRFEVLTYLSTIFRIYSIEPDLIPNSRLSSQWNHFINEMNLWRHSVNCPLSTNVNADKWATVVTWKIIIDILGKKEDRFDNETRIDYFTRSLECRYLWAMIEVLQILGGWIFFFLSLSLHLIFFFFFLF